MRMMTKRGVSIALVAALGFARQAAATDAGCPAPSQIKEWDGAYGWVYTAKVGTDTWEGSNPHGTAGDAETFELIEVTVRNGYVACDYVGKRKAAGVRLSLETAKQLEPANAPDWTDNHCTVSGSITCAFQLKPRSTP